jgi:hypothetical protein
MDETEIYLTIMNPTLDAVVWAFIGALFMALYNIYQGWQKSERTTNMFSFRELALNPKNWLRCGIAVLAMAIALKFLPDLMNMEINAFSGILIGLSSGKLADAIASKQNFVPNQIKGK